MNNSELIYNFWYNNPKYWITIKNRENVDKLIFDKFSHIKLEYNNISNKIDYLAYIIYNDQFIRHFSRYLGHKLTNDNLELCYDYSFYDTLDNIELYFALMPFKHIENYKFILDYLYNKKLDNLLTRFYHDTLTKYFKTIKPTLVNIENPNYDIDKICEYYPSDFKTNWFLDNIVKDNTLVNILKAKLSKNKKYSVSLSGGVDSMVSLALLKLLDYDVVAIHIVYGNRSVSKMELEFLADFCKKIDVQLYKYEIEYIRRDNIDRLYYETTTRDIRFRIYKLIGYPVLMGHIMDDVIENIWSNIAKNQHLDNLGKMVFSEVCEGVEIIRPFLEIDKKKIYAMSKNLEIPYLKDTTPEWSNRGKFRNSLHDALKKQFGDSIDKKVVEFSNNISNMFHLLDKLLFSKIINSFNNNMVIIDRSIKLDDNTWLYIFTNICHNKLHIKKPSIHSIRQFITRLNTDKPCIKVEMSKYFSVIVDNNILRFIINTSSNSHTSI